MEQRQAERAGPHHGKIRYKGQRIGSRYRPRQTRRESPLSEGPQRIDARPESRTFLEKESQRSKEWIEGMACFRPRKSPIAVDNTPVTQNDVVPIMLVRCTVCHGGRRQEGGLDLRTREPC